jgi:hypothetical protein
MKGEDSASPRASGEVTAGNAPGEYRSIEELYDYCGDSHPCGTSLPCEGTMVKVKGHVDYVNVFDHKHYPQLPYEKFALKGEHGKLLEIWVITKDSEKIFDVIWKNKQSPPRTAYIKGRVVGFDMPVMGKCLKGFRIDIDQDGGIFFGD